MPPHVQVQLQPGDDGPVVVKTALTDEGRARIASEGSRLGRAGHPGVVELVRRTDQELVLAWAGGETLGLRRPPVTEAAGILAAVAATVADLHEVGIVHGRLDASHVVLDGEGRPRLCGLRGPGAGDAPPMPTDDVRALGDLIDVLVGGEVEVEPIPERRWGARRWAGYQRRALQSVADRATHEDPARRPTARALAAAIAAAVPEARLVPGRHVPTSTPSPLPDPAPAPADPDAVSRRSPPPPVRAVDHPVPTVPAPAVPTAPGRASGTSAGRPRRGASADPPAPPAPAPPPSREAHEPQPSTEAAAPRSEIDERARRAEGSLDAADEPVGGPTAPRSGRRRATAVATVAGLVIAAALWQAIGTGSPGDPAAHRAEGPPAAAAPARPPAPDGSGCPGSKGSADGEGSAGGEGSDRIDPDQIDPEPEVDPGVDVDGDRCPDEVGIAGTRIRAAGKTFAVGRAGDHVAVRDWDCDGTATPGLVRPATGEVFLFASWATEVGEVTVRPTAVVPHARAFEELGASPARPGGECPAATVVRTDGTLQDVPVDTTVEAPR